MVGVREAEDKSLDAAGLPSFKDKADVSNGLKNVLPTDLLRHIDVVDFSFDASEYPSLIGKRFQVLFVGSEAKELPYVALKGGAKLRANSIYVRKEGITEEASHDELQRLINSRIDTGYSSTKELDLEQDIAQLKILFNSVPRTIPGGSKLGIWIETFTALSTLQEPPKPNPKYPAEEFDEFILKMIELKKNRIAAQLGVKE